MSHVPASSPPYARSATPSGDDAPSHAGSPNAAADGDGASERKRRRFVRSKNGCLTCKRRKVKCDERTPTCMRCESESRECMGYAGPPRPRIADARAAQALRQAADGLTSLGAVAMHSPYAPPLPNQQLAASAGEPPRQSSASHHWNGDPFGGAPDATATATATTNATATNHAFGVPAQPSSMQAAGPSSLPPLSTPFHAHPPPQPTGQPALMPATQLQGPLEQLDDWLSRLVDTHAKDPGTGAGDWAQEPFLFEWMDPALTSYSGSPVDTAGRSRGSVPSISTSPSSTAAMGAPQSKTPGVLASPSLADPYSHMRQSLSAQHPPPLPLRRHWNERHFAGQHRDAAHANGARSSSTFESDSTTGAPVPAQVRDERPSDSTLQQRLKGLCSSQLQLQAITRFFNHVAQCFHLLPTDVNNWRLVYAELCCSSALIMELVTSVGLISLSLFSPPNRRPLAYAMLTGCLARWKELVRRGEASHWRKRRDDADAHVGPNRPTSASASASGRSGALSDLEILEVVAGAIMIGHFEQFDNGLGIHTVSCMTTCKRLIECVVGLPPEASPVDQSPGSPFRFCVRVFLWWDTLSRTMGPGSGGEWPRRTFEVVRGWEEECGEVVTDTSQCISGWPLDMLEAVARTTALSQAIRRPDGSLPTTSSASAPRDWAPHPRVGHPAAAAATAAAAGGPTSHSLLSLSSHTFAGAVTEARSIETQIRCARPRAVLQDSMLTAELRYIIFETLRAGALVYFARVLVPEAGAAAGAAAAAAGTAGGGQGGGTATGTSMVRDEISQVIRFLRRREAPREVRTETEGRPDDAGRAGGITTPGERAGHATSTRLEPSRGRGEDAPGSRGTTRFWRAPHESARARGHRDGSGGRGHDAAEAHAAPDGAEVGASSGGSGGGGGRGGSHPPSPRRRTVLLSAEVERRGPWHERSPDGALLWSYLQAAMLVERDEEESCARTMERWKRFADCGAVDLLPELLSEMWARRRLAEDAGQRAPSADEACRSVMRDRRWKQLLVF